MTRYRLSLGPVCAAIALVASLFYAPVAVAEPMTASSPVAISGPDPEMVGTCTKAGQEGEVSLAADPEHSNRFVAVWEQNVRSSEFWPLAIVAAYSDDSGRTWSRTGEIPHMTHCTGAETGAQCVNATDDDGDGKVNDGCPANGTPETGAQCDNATDDDGDLAVNDGCPVNGSAPETGAQCDNATDDDGDLAVNDGCPANGPAETGVAQCVNATDDDGDLAVNDGCPEPRAPTDPDAQGNIDPSVAIGRPNPNNPDSVGISYLASIGGYDVPLPGQKLAQAQVHRWTGGAANWSDFAIVEDRFAQADRPRVVADPSDDPSLAEHAYMVWLDETRGTEYMARTEDGGVSWTKGPEPIATTGVQLVVIPGDICETPDGFLASCEMVLVLLNFGAPDPRGTTDAPFMSASTHVFTTRSSDGGVNWSPPSPLLGSDGLPLVLPAKSAPHATAAPDGTIYMAWWNAEQNEPTDELDPSCGRVDHPIAVKPETCRIEIVRSVGVGPDENLVWSDVMTVSAAGDPQPRLLGNGSVLQGPGPVVAVDSSGAVGVLWYDRRNKTTPLPRLSDVWFAYSRDHGATGTWTETRLAGTSNNVGPSPGGNFNFADDASLIPVRDGFAAAYTLGSPFDDGPGGVSDPNYAIVDPSSTHPNPPSTDVFFSHITAVDLSLTKRGSPDTLPVGSLLTYTLDVTNNGLATARGVTLTDLLPKNVRLRSADSDHGRCAQRTLRRIECNLAELSSGETATVTIVVRPTKKGTIVNTATVSASQPADLNLTNNTATETTEVSP
jgi:uncharacterized repeat protein (TIGR01451 family)